MIDLREVGKALYSRAWLIGIVTVLAAALLLAIAVFLVEPTYSASVQLYVNNNAESNIISSSQVAAAQALADTYIVILESRSVLTDVQKQTQLPYSYKALKKMVDGVAVNGTEVIQVTVTCTDYVHAAQIANAIAQVMPDKIAAVVQGSSVRVVDYAVEDPNPVGPNHLSYLVLGAFLGMVLSAACVIIGELSDTSIHSEEYLSEVYGNIPLLAVVPGMDSEKSGGKGYYEAKPRELPKKMTGGAR